MTYEKLNIQKYMIFSYLGHKEKWHNGEGKIANKISIAKSIALLNKININKFEFIESFLNIDGFVNLRFFKNFNKIIGVIFTEEKVYTYEEIENQILPFKEVKFDKKLIKKIEEN